MKPGKRQKADFIRMVWLAAMLGCVLTGCAWAEDKLRTHPR